MVGKATSCKDTTKSIKDAMNTSPYSDKEYLTQNILTYYEDEDEEDNIEYDVCRIKRDWGPGEEGSLIGHSMVGEMESEKQDVPFFTKLFTLSQILGILAVVLIGVWCGNYRGGFAWTSQPTLQFNWHPFLMVLGMVFLYANGALIYRGFRFEKKKKLKLLHMSLMVGAFVCSVVGLVAVFDSHNLMDPPIPNMYSLHSWMGISTVLLFTFQWVSGLVTFLLPGLRPTVRSAYLPVHQFFGLFIFVSAVATCLVGITEKTFFSIVKTYSTFPAEGILINMTGIVLIIFAAIVVYLVTNPKFRRQTTEDEVLLTDTVLE